MLWNSGVTAGRASLVQYFEESLRFAQIPRTQPLSEPFIDRGEDGSGLLSWFCFCSSRTKLIAARSSHDLAD